MLPPYFRKFLVLHRYSHLSLQEKLLALLISLLQFFQINEGLCVCPDFVISDFGQIILVNINFLSEIILIGFYGK